VDNWTAAAQAGGAFAIVLAGLAAIGKALAWLLNFHGERSDGKAADLRAWQASLTAREKDYRETLEGDLSDLKGQVAQLRNDVGALGHSLLEVTTELRDLDPASEALLRATLVLRRAFSPVYSMPGDMQQLARDLDGDPAR
jgi:hypothetical protein